MSKSFSESYKEAGVDITAGYKSVELMKEHISRTMTEGARLGESIGGFGGLFTPIVAQNIANDQSEYHSNKDDNQLT